jgi:histidinol phosphatase-like PHP family hydrolase
MIDLHTHSFLSDGELLPEELIRRAEETGYRIIGITDHVGPSNIETVISQLIKTAKHLNKVSKIKAIAGIELTHTPLSLIKPLAQKARNLGAQIIIVHGETIVEPVIKGTNKAALNSNIDILAHPGLITKEDVLLAKRKHIFLEISARGGHSLSNGHVAGLAQKIGAPLLLNSDAHKSEDLINKDFDVKIDASAGLHPLPISNMFKNAEKLSKRILKKY